MVHSVDIGRGIIGVIDVTDVMVIIPCDHTSIISSSRSLACASTRPKIPMLRFLQVGVFKLSDDDVGSAGLWQWKSRGSK